MGPSVLRGDRAVFDVWGRPNFLSLEGDERVKAAYGANYDRSVELEKEYDPANLFRTNQNIEPSV